MLHLIGGRGSVRLCETMDERKRESISGGKSFVFGREMLLHLHSESLKKIKGLQSSKTVTRP